MRALILASVLSVVGVAGEKTVNSKSGHSDENSGFSNIPSRVVSSDALSDFPQQRKLVNPTIHLCEDCAGLKTANN